MVLAKLLRAGEGKILRRLTAIAEHIDAIGPDFEPLSDAELRAKTDEFKERYADGETLDDLLPEAFATVREAAVRTIGQRHYTVQLMGGAAMHMGNVAEMKTGEGKTLVATLPAYLNALNGEGVHIITVNDYLAKYHAEWMGRVHRFLGLEVGIVLSQLPTETRRAAYAADITYGTNNEFGFDYLRDNMKQRKEDLVQRGHTYAIVDEVDSILIDEARTPLIISGNAEQSARWYQEFARLVPLMKADVHYEVEEGKRTAAVTEEGVSYIEDQLGIENLYEAANTPLIGHLNNALKAKELYKRDRDYIVNDGQVLIVDEFTGRVLHGRRFNEGMHQAIEAKESVQIQQESQTLATVTLQNYFRLYDKLAGMTGTAQTEANELHQTYNLGVVTIPTNMPMIRIDQPDIVYQTEAAKFDAVVDDIAERNENGQPILVGTASVAKSEYLSGLLLRRGIPHEVLNAKYHEKEAAIVAAAGHEGAVTVATNMAGRGTDIMLGGNPEFMADLDLRTRGLSPSETPEEYEQEWDEAVAAAKRRVAKAHKVVTQAGGMYVLGTERHDSRRIDNQLRGRSGRQGDPGESRFYLSLGDDLMRRFNANTVESIMSRLRIDEDQPIESKMVSRAIKSAQTQVEQQNFETRKDLLKYDEVLSKQREVIYTERRKVLEGADLQGQVLNMLDDVVTAYVEGATAEGYPEDWNLEQLWIAVKGLFPITLTVDDVITEAGGDVSDLTTELLIEKISESAREAYAGKEAELGSDLMRELERRVVLEVLDHKWREHLYEMDYLKEGIRLRAMAQRDPLVEYKREGFNMFTAMLDGIKEESVGYLFKLRPAEPEPEEAEAPAEAADGEDAKATAEPTKAKPKATAPERATRRAPAMATTGLRAPELDSVQYSAPSLNSGDESSPTPKSTTVTGSEPGRNAPCPCGSGKKYKRCHGAPAGAH